MFYSEGRTETNPGSRYEALITINQLQKIITSWELRNKTSNTYTENMCISKKIKSKYIYTHVYSTHTYQETKIRKL